MGKYNKSHFEEPVQTNVLSHETWYLAEFIEMEKKFMLS
jgi:hypothetical protein